MFKKIFIITAVLCGLGLSAAAQNRNIEFEENQPWKEVLEKARTAGKYIFMDCYTDWCGPCKMLDRDVFHNDRIADHYNEHFVNAKYDMEKGEGVELSRKYAVTAYPTLLFIDPKTEQVVHRVVGAGNVDHMLEQARIAVDPAGNLQGAKRAFEAGEKNAANLEQYMLVLRRAGMSAEQNRVTVEYLDGLTPEEFAREENWKLFESYVTDPLSAPAQAVYADRAAFAKEVGAKRVDRKLGSMLMIAANRFRNKEAEPVADFDRGRFDALVEFMSDVEDTAAPGCLAQLYAAGYAQDADYAGMIDALNNALKYNLVQGRMKSIFYMTYLTKLIGRTDPAVQNDAVALVDRLIGITDDDHLRASFMLIESMMLDSYGRAAEAAAMKQKADELRRTSAGQPVRMM